METAVVRSFRIFGTLLQKAGPYLLLEILLPGGTLFALLLFLYKRRQQSGAEMPRVISSSPARSANSTRRSSTSQDCTASPPCGVAARASAMVSKRWRSRPDM